MARSKAERDAEKRFEKDLHDWLTEAASSGRYEGFDGMVVGWSLWVERLRPEEVDEEGFDEGWFTSVGAPGQRPSVSLGHLEACKAFYFGGYADRGRPADDEG